MEISLTERARPRDELITMSSDEFVRKYNRNEKAMSALARLITTKDPQYFDNYILHMPPNISDPQYYTSYDMEPVKDPEEPVIERKGMITEFEVRALQGVEIVEYVSDPISKSNIAKGAIRLGCTLARAFR